MKKSKIFLSLLLALVIAVASVALLVSCGEDPTPDSTESTGTPSGDSSTVPSTGNSTTDSSTTDSKPSQGDDIKKSNYTIQIVDKNTGKPVSNVSVFIYDEADFDGNMYARGKTDENGFVTLACEAKYAKYVCVENFPKGYVYNDFYALGATGVKIEVGTELIPNTGSLANKNLALGDVMYDFEITTVAGETIKLSDLFANGKKAVMLNFWYTTCTYCIEEFPYIQSAYEQYKDDIEIIGINAYPTDNEKKINQFLQDFAKPGYYTEEGCELTFPMAVDTLSIQDAFGFTVNPCTVIVDRYGVISMIQVGGVMGERYFTNALAHYTADNYEQELYASIYDLSPMIKPDIEMSPESEIKDAVVPNDINISFRPETEGEDAEYSWPFIVVEKDGEMCIATTNTDIDSSYSIIYADVELKAGQGIMFDYFASTERVNDVLYVLVNGKDIYTISGRPLENDDGSYAQDPWQACCPWVATEDGIYEIAFCYIKDESDKDGDDRIYLDNFRVVEEEDIEIETYIPRYAATDLQTDNTYANYVDVVLNKQDGYYHVGTEDGPILLAGLIGVNTQFYNKLSEEERTTVTIKLTSDGEFIMNGKDVYNSFIMYCNYASNSKLYGYCPVTEELRVYLEEYVKQNDFITDENTWLQLCSYYNAYGTDEQFGDPIKGLATFSAYEAIVTQPGEVGFKNSVTYTQIIMPRGLLYKFVPTESGVYRITSKSSQEVDGWVFTGNFQEWVAQNGGDRILYLDSSTGERYCPELLIDPDGDGVLERDFKNVSMIGYFEAGVEYYIDIAYYDVYGAGTFTFDVKYVAESFDVFVEASPGVFTYEEGVGDIIAGGIDVKLCEDENDPRYGYYCHLLPNGELGSIVYADFHYTTNIFSTQSIKVLIEEGAFNMKMTAIDREAYVYFKNYYEKDGISALEELWGDEFEANWEFYQMDDIIEGIYHGNGVDYTEDMRAYLDKIEDGTNGENGDIIYPERQGCVPVDAELAVMLQALMDKFTFAGVDNSWTKLCYYYNSLGASKSSADKLAELETMIENAEIDNEDIQAEINSIYEELMAALENWTTESVRKNLIDSASRRIYALIEADE